MVNSNKNRKEFITEGDISTLLERYDTTTILKFLQEMAYYAEPKMDWNELVKKTTTGITSAREYRLLWRHLAYRDSLTVEEDDAQPLDDDSDTECELEASPAAGVDVVAEAVAHVKVMAASYVPSESDIPDNSTVEAPLTINIPYSLHRGAQQTPESHWSSVGMNICFPVSLQKATSRYGLNGNGLASIMGPRKRRKKWSAEDDEELIAAVERHGEGNWALIAKGDFEGERKASQLSQRWGDIRRRCDTSNSATQSGLQRTEEQMAVNHALSLAVGNRGPSKKVALGTSIPPMFSSSSSITGARTCGVNGANSLHGQQQTQPGVQALPRAAISASAAKSRASVKKTTANPTSRSELVETANSVAAAACMIGTSTAASVPKVEPGKNAATSVAKAEPLRNVATASVPRPTSSLSAPKAGPVKNASAASLPRPLSSLSVPKAGPVKNASAASLPRPLSSLAAPKTELAKSVASATNPQTVGPLNTGQTVNGNPNRVMSLSPSNRPPPMAPRPKGSTIQHVPVSSTLAPRVAPPTQRVSVVTAPATVLPRKPSAEVVNAASCKPDGVQKEKTQGTGPIPFVTALPNKTISKIPSISTVALAAKVETPKLTPKKNPVVLTEVGSCVDKSSLNKPPEKESKSTISPSVLTDAKSKAKDEVSSRKCVDVAAVVGTAQSKTTIPPAIKADGDSKAKDEKSNGNRPVVATVVGAGQAIKLTVPPSVGGADDANEKLKTK